MRSGPYVRAARQETANTLSRNNTYQCVSVLSIKQWHITQVSNAYVWMNCIFQAQNHIEKWFKDLSGLFSIYNLSFFFSPSSHLMKIQVPSEKILRAGKILRNAILSRAPHMIRDRKYHLKTYRYVWYK